MARSKSGAQPVVIDGIRFPSKKEGRRYKELKLLERAREIMELERKPNYDLVVNGIKITTYQGDFQYFEKGQPITEDTKGYQTREYKIKKKLMLALYGIKIRET